MDMKIPQTKKEKLHAELRGLLARHRIDYKQASEIVGIPYGSFRQSVRTDRFSNKKAESIINQIEEAIEAEVNRP